MALAGLPLGAATLGDMAGQATIGRPLQVRVPVSMAGWSDAARACARAEVQYGDTRVGGAQVELREVAPGRAMAHVRAGAAVDEPVVSVLLHVGCEPAVSRRYVLLADPPGAEPEPVAMPVAATATATATGAAPARPAAAVLGSAGQARPVRTAAAQPKAAPAAVAKSDPRLQLALLDPATERRILLKVSSGLLAAPLEDNPQRAAAAAMWQAISAQPQDLLRMAERLRSLETDMAGLREASLRQRREVTGLREMVAAPDHRADWMLAALAVLSAAGAAAFFGWRAGRHRPAFAAWLPQPDTDSRFEAAAPAERAGGPAARADEPGPVPDSLLDRSVDELERIFEEFPGRPARPAEPPVLRERAAEPQPAEAAPAPAVAAPQPPEPRALPDLEFTAASEPAPPSFFAQDPPPGPLLEAFEFDLAAPAAAEPAPAPALAAAVQPSRTEALVEAQQQAAFLCSLGQFEEAMALLDGYLEEAPEPPLLAFLELMAIQRGLGDRHGFHKSRVRFRRRFGFLPADWDEFVPGEGLDAHPESLRGIEAAWSQPQVFEAIDRELFAAPRGAAGMPGLNAGRELLWLWALALAREHGADELDLLLDQPDEALPA